MGVLRHPRKHLPLKHRPRRHRRQRKRPQLRLLRRKLLILASCEKVDLYHFDCKQFSKENQSYAINCVTFIFSIQLSGQIRSSLNQGFHIFPYLNGTIPIWLTFGMLTGICQRLIANEISVPSEFYTHKREREFHLTSLCC